MNRDRRLEPVDVAAASGLLATFFGAALLSLSTEGRFQILAMEPKPHADLDVERVIEPGLGEAVVASAIVDHKHSREMSRAARKLTTAAQTADRLTASGNERVHRLVDTIKGEEANKTARVEFVKGRSIANATLRAKRGQGLPNEQWESFNQRLITTAANEGNRIEGAFRVTAPDRFRTALETDTVINTAAMQQSQERAGAAVMKTGLVENQYEQATGRIQEQIGSLIATASRSEML
jgi:hypothetical protein